MVRRRFHRAAIAVALTIGLAGALGTPASADGEGPSLPTPGGGAVSQMGSGGDEPEINEQGLCVDVDMDPGTPCVSEAIGNENLNVCIRADGGVVSDVGRSTGLAEQAGLACEGATPEADSVPEDQGGESAPEHAAGESPEPVRQAEPAEAVVQQPNFTG